MKRTDPAEADDLPDIVDLVMEMGHPTQHEQRGGEEGVPSPSLPVRAKQQERLPGHLERLADRARDYVEAASSANTRRAYAADWKYFCAWCRRQSFEPLPPDPQIVGLYITAQASARGATKRRCRRSSAACPP